MLHFGVAVAVAALLFLVGLDAFDDSIDVVEESDYSLGWARWSRWSSCTRSCGSGLQYQLRRCLDVRCSGPSSRHRVCSVEPCPGRVQDLSSLQPAQALADSECAHLGARSSVIVDSRSCTFKCASSDRRSAEEVVLELHQPDGTRCLRSTDDERSGVCLKGKCRAVGCDGVIESSARVDECGVCGGNGKSCGKDVVFAWRDTQQFSPCDKSCGNDSYQVSVSVCYNRLTNRVVSERLCADQKRPRPVVRPCPAILCPSRGAHLPALDYTWLATEWSTCSATCGFGVQRRVVFCVETQSSASVEASTESGNNDNDTTGIHRKVNEAYCSAMARPAEERRCGADACPLWVEGEWSTCSASCGLGVQTRMVECRTGGLTGRVVLDARCGVRGRPPDIKQCFNTAECDGLQLPESMAPSSNTNRVDRFRFVAESPFTGMQWNDGRGAYNMHEEPVRLLHGFPGSDDDKTKPKFNAGTWSECSTTCGPGVKTRTVECVAFQGMTSNVIKLPDYECDAETKPPLFQPCQTQSCPQMAADGRSGSGANMHPPPVPSSIGRGVYRWDYGEWGPCSASCLGGRQKSTLKCIDTSRKASVPWSHCDAKQRPVDLWRDCNREPCPPAWEVGPLGDCSHPCGGGIRTRKVRCVRQISQTGGAASTLILPDAQCPATKPAHQEPCGLSDCPPSWRVDQWSACSASCGSGEQRRSVVCEQRSAGGVVKVFEPATPCLTTERPPTIQLCDLGPCDAIGPYDVAPLEAPYPSNGPRPRHIDNFEQSHPGHGKLTFDLGGVATIYEGTSIKVKCPVRNYDRSRILWTKDGERLRNNAHVKVSTNGALRIFHARREDAGLYACFANGARGNITLSFKAKEPNTLEDNRTRPQTSLSNESADDDADVDEALSPSDVDGKLLEHVRASLRAVGEHAFEERVRVLREPGALRVDYVTGDWSVCSQMECGKPDGTQVRLIRCRATLEHAAAYIGDDVCDAYGVPRPTSSKSCHNTECPEWEAAEWTECSASRCIREQTAIQRRDVKCLYLNGTEADFNLCDRKERPKIKKECVNVNCTAEWKPSVWGKCSKHCGRGGVQMRLLRCVWRGTKKAAGRHCNLSLKPKTIRSCPVELPPCRPGQKEAQSPLLADGTCEDKSRFCEILKLFHSCDEPNIRARCCHSCRHLQ